MLTVVGKNTIDNIKEGAKVLKEGDLKGAVGLGTDIALGKGAGNVVRKVLGTDGNQTNEQTAQTNEQTVQEQENQKVAKKEDYDGDISSIFFPEPQQLSKGGRVNKALGGPIDLAARKKQSQLDYLARQGKSAPQPQPPTGGLTGPGVTKPAVNPQTPGTQPSGMTSGAATPYMGSSMGGLTGPGVTQPPPGLTFLRVSGLLERIVPAFFVSRKTVNRGQPHFVVYLDATVNERL